MGKVCVAGCEALSIDYSARMMRVGETVLHEGDWLSVDGSTGEVIQGEIKTRPSEVLQVLVEGTLEVKKSRVYRQYARLMKWADEVRTLGVRTNTDQPDQARVAKAFGAEGIGLAVRSTCFSRRQDSSRTRDDSGGRRSG
jgi:pyruvate,orthophosphate dikinase